jgi:hypothetical protein
MQGPLFNDIRVRQTDPETGEEALFILRCFPEEKENRVRYVLELYNQRGPRRGLFAFDLADLAYDLNMLGKPQTIPSRIYEPARFAMLAKIRELIAEYKAKPPEHEELHTDNPDPDLLFKGKPLS